MTILQKHKGALSELRASAWLLDQGYEVFRNVSAHGPVDLIAMHPDTKEISLFDVKTRHPSYNDNWIRNVKLNPEVRIISFDPSRNEVKIET